MSSPVVLMRVTLCSGQSSGIRRFNSRRSSADTSPLATVIRCVISYVTGLANVRSLSPGSADVLPILPVPKTNANGRSVRGRNNIVHRLSVATIQLSSGVGLARGPAAPPSNLILSLVPANQALRLH